ncbi:MAG: DUF1003 domain-containing protein [Ignavibacteria bacterium]|nr:DUF1003 domain-containing protein [Ignavibacteria bacterium]
MLHDKIFSLKELRERYKKIVNPNEQIDKNLTPLNRFALSITNKVGSMGFFLLILIWTVSWLGFNTLAPKDLRFDPFPAFVLWLFISNMIQIFLMPLIMIGQNLQANHSEIRAQSDFEINTKAEQEIETILMHLENQNQIILQILDKMSNAEEELKKRSQG